MKTTFETLKKLPYLKESRTIIRTLKGKIEIINRNEIEVIDEVLKDVIFKIENGDEFLSEKESAEFLDISIAMLQKLHKDNFISCYIVKSLEVFNQRIYSKDELIKLSAYSISVNGYKLMEIYKEIKDVFFKIADLTEREDYVINNLTNGKTLEDISKQEGISRERVRQTMQKAIRRARGRVERKMEVYDAVLKENELLRNSIAEKNNIITFLKQNLIENKLSIEDKNTTLFCQKIMDFDLSLRAINSLKANDIYTIGDLYEKTKFNNNELLKFRNIGKKTQYEFHPFMQELREKMLK